MKAHLTPFALILYSFLTLVTIKIIRLYDASVIALRPHDLNHNPPVVLVYYQPQDIWQPRSPIDPSVFIGVDVERHLHVYSLLASQVRSHRSPDLIRAMLKVYGACIGNEYALPFKLLRLALSR